MYGVTPSLAGRSFSTVRIGSVQVVAARPSTAAEAVCHAAKHGTGAAHVHLVNAYTVGLAEGDSAYRGSLTDGAVNLPDGRPLTWVSRLRRDKPRLHQVRGPALFLRVVDYGRAWGLKHFLLGSTPEVLAALEENLTRKYPGVQIVGTLSPPFRPLSNVEQAEQDRIVTASGADIVWVGLGTPKQDFEAARVARSTGLVTVAIGAAFDFAAGTKREAPRLLAFVGLEWLFRLATEPRRLWRRYLFGNLAFLRSVGPGGRSL